MNRFEFLITNNFFRLVSNTKEIENKMMELMKNRVWKNGRAKCCFFTIQSCFFFFCFDGIVNGDPFGDWSIVFYR